MLKSLSNWKERIQRSKRVASALRDSSFLDHWVFRRSTFFSLWPLCLCGSYCLYYGFAPFVVKSVFNPWLLFLTQRHYFHTASGYLTRSDPAKFFFRVFRVFRGYLIKYRQNLTNHETHERSVIFRG